MRTDDELVTEDDFDDQDEVEELEDVYDDDEEESDLDLPSYDPSNEEPERSSKDEVKDKALIFARAVFAEFVCTSIFMFIVTTAQLQLRRGTNLKGVAEIHNPIVGALAGALGAVGVIYSFADVSGAHFNPAVTFATCITMKTSWLKGFFYVAAQLLGSLFAALIVALSFPEGLDAVRLVAVHHSDDVTIWQCFFIEFVLSFIFVYVIFAVAFDTVDANPSKVAAKGKGVGGKKLTIYATSGDTKAGYAPIAIGFTLGACVFASGTISGGAFNPARVFGFALVGDVWDIHWVYWVADLSGAALAGFVQKIFAKPKLTPPRLSEIGALVRFICYDKTDAPFPGVKNMLRTWAWG
eukprot:TRINITY_DN3333_c0_g1_i1.p1 TRINITY_DN3333_c0_g1~~TRINITY_DN3333_c0_g1_i1.p1  ORF type:complete len:353 (-),score=87.28 TRINITY_DN3333_c0_g1_i1:36-1094(-)